MDNFAANPNKWPIQLEYKDGNGDTKMYHRGCITALIEKCKEEAEYKEITGFDNYKELFAFERGSAYQLGAIFKWIEEWDGSTNSHLGNLLKKKYNQFSQTVNTAQIIRQLYEEIKHGDEEHQNWLKHKIEEFIKERNL